MSDTCACTNRKMTPRVEARPPMGEAVFNRTAVVCAGVSRDCRADEPGNDAAAAAIGAAPRLLLLGAAADTP